MRQPALDGLRVIDLGQRIAGPFCAKLMADHGAEVVKIERPGLGDASRRVGPFYHDEPGLEKSLLFLYANTGKKSITLDLRLSVGAVIFEELARKADVVIENFRPGTMERLGLGYETLEKINPRLVMTSISNFGQYGPYRNWKATEMVMQAMGGMMCLVGDPDREPLKVGGHQAEYMGALNAFIGTLTALMFREDADEGQHIDVSIQECISSILEYNLSAYAYMGAVLKRWHNRHLFSFPADVYPCKDGFAVTGAVRVWEDLATMLDAPELAQERFTTTNGRVEHADEFVAAMMSALREQGRDELFHNGQQWHFAFGKVLGMAELMEDPQLAARQAWVEVEHPALGKALYPGHPYRMTETQWELGPAPSLGQHTEEILGSLGYSPADLEALRKKGVI